MVYFLALSKGSSLLEKSGLGDRVPIVGIPYLIMVNDTNK